MAGKLELFSINSLIKNYGNLDMSIIYVTRFKYIYTDK